jgi:hypothetical protein
MCDFGLAVEQTQFASTGLNWGGDFEPGISLQGQLKTFFHFVGFDKKSLMVYNLNSVRLRLAR